MTARPSHMLLFTTSSVRYLNISCKINSGSFLANEKIRILGASRVTRQRHFKPEDERLWGREWVPIIHVREVPRGL